MCKECDILPLAPFGVRLDYWWCCHHKKFLWAALILFVISLLMLITVKLVKNYGGTEKGNKLDKSNSENFAISSPSVAHY